MSGHQRTLAALSAEPTPANWTWKDIETLLISLGAELEEGDGSRSRVLLNGIPSTFHRPHPRKEASEPQVGSVREFLRLAGVVPDPGRTEHGIEPERPADTPAAESPGPVSR